MTLLSIVGSLVVLSGPAHSVSQESSVELPSVTLPREIDRVLRDYERAWRAGDPAPPTLTIRTSIHPVDGLD